MPLANPLKKSLENQDNVSPRHKETDLKSISEVDQYFGAMELNKGEAPVTHLLNQRFKEEIQNLSLPNFFPKKLIQRMKPMVKMSRLREKNKSKLSPFFFEP